MRKMRSPRETSRSLATCARRRLGSAPRRARRRRTFGGRGRRSDPHARGRASRRQPGRRAAPVGPFESDVRRSHPLCPDCPPRPAVVGDFRSLTATSATVRMPVEAERFARCRIPSDPFPFSANLPNDDYPKLGVPHRGSSPAPFRRDCTKRCRWFLRFKEGKDPRLTRMMLANGRRSPRSAQRSGSAERACRSRRRRLHRGYRPPARRPGKEGAPCESHNRGYSDNESSV
jgi:hypothetical protein